MSAAARGHFVPPRMVTHITADILSPLLVTVRLVKEGGLPLPLP